MRQVSPAHSGLPTSVDRYLLPDERSVITVRMHPAALAGPLVLACGGLVAARKLSGRSPRPEHGLGEGTCSSRCTSCDAWQPGRSATSS